MLKRFNISSLGITNYFRTKCFSSFSFNTLNYNNFSLLQVREDIISKNLFELSNINNQNSVQIPVEERNIELMNKRSKQVKKKRAKRKHGKNISLRYR
jgi:hypothetical protein